MQDRGVVEVGQRGDELVILRKLKDKTFHGDKISLSLEEAKRVGTYLCSFLGHPDEDDQAEVLGWRKPSIGKPPAQIEILSAPVAAQAVLAPEGPLAEKTS